jgi:hypothetical protein
MQWGISTYKKDSPGGQRDGLLAVPESVTLVNGTQAHAGMDMQEKPKEGVVVGS